MGFFDRFNPKFKDKDPNVRLVAIAETDSQKVLCGIVLSDDEESVRDAALERVTDISYLEKIALKSVHGPTKKTAVKKIQEEDALKRLVTSSDDIVAMSAAKNAYLKDKDFMFELAKNTIQLEMGVELVKKLAGTPFIETLAQSAALWEIREASDHILKGPELEEFHEGEAPEGLGEALVDDPEEEASSDESNNQKEADSSQSSEESSFTEPDVASAEANVTNSSVETSEDMSEGEQDPSDSVEEPVERGEGLNLGMPKDKVLSLLGEPVKATTLKDVLKKLDRESEITADFVDKEYLLFDSADGHYKLVFQEGILHQVFESP